MHARHALTTLLTSVLLTALPVRADVHRPAPPIQHDPVASPGYPNHGARSGSNSITSHGLTATASSTQPVVVGKGSSTAAPSLAYGNLFLTVDIPATLMGPGASSASLLLSASCQGIDNPDVLPVHTYKPPIDLPLPRSLPPVTVLQVSLPWDGGATELTDSDYYSPRSYSCTANVQLSVTTSRGTKTASAVANSIVWNVQVAEQAASIPTSQPSDGSTLNTATFTVTAFDGSSTDEPVTVGVAPGTEQDTFPPGSNVVISLSQPDPIPPGTTATPFFAAPVVDLGPEGSTFTQPVILGLVPSGPFATTNPIPITYDEDLQDWVDCREDGSCVHVDCTPEDGFEPGTYCIEVYHFSTWSLANGEHAVIQVELMSDDESTPAPDWKCGTGVPCPSGMSGRYAYTHVADTSSLRARIRVCITSGNTCDGATLISGLEYTDPLYGQGWDSPKCFNGSCPFYPGPIYEDPPLSGIYYFDLNYLTVPGWGSIEASINASRVFKVKGAVVDDAGSSTNCIGDTPKNGWPKVYECLSLAVSPRIDQATWNGSAHTLTVTTSKSFNTGSNPPQNLQGGGLSLYWTDNCDQSEWTYSNELNSVQVEDANKATGQSSAMLAAHVRAQVATGNYGTVIGPCVTVDADGDGFTAAQGDCDDTNAAAHPGATEVCNGKDDNCNRTIDEGVTTNYYVDGDKDGYGKAGSTTTSACSSPTGYVANNTDCNDTSAAIHPYAVELSADHVDNNCNGRIDEILPVIDGGGAHTLLADSHGMVWAAGDNYDGQLGNGSSVDSEIPVAVSSLSSIVSVAAGYVFSLALDSQGHVWSWGYNRDGQLGDGSTVSKQLPGLLPSLSGIIAVSAGAGFSLALDNQGHVWAWGDNTYGQLGDGSQIDRPTPVQVSSLNGITAIAAGGDHALALDGQGRVWAWGWNYFGQLGDGTQTNRLSPVLISSLKGIVALAAGWQHSLALDNLGNIWVWGDNYVGELGTGSSTSSMTPIQLLSLSGIIAIDASGSHSVVLDSQGRVWTWGYPYEGRTPNQVSSLTGIVAIGAGEEDSFALDSQGRLWGWEGNSDGQLGDGSRSTVSSPIQVSSLNGAVAVAAGSTHALALDNQGRLWSWGNNKYGKLGDGTTTDRQIPVRVSSLTGVVAATAGWDYSLALDSQGHVWAWGEEYYDGATSPSSTPVEVSSLTGIVAIAAGFYALALDGQGRVWSWGAYSKAVPTQVSGMSGIVAIAAGIGVSLALDSKGYVWAWGGNTYGQLGNGTTSPSSTPVKVSSVSAIVAIAAGWQHSLALDSLGRVWAWGDNSYGQLGLGHAVTISSTPVQVPGMSGAAGVAAGDFHSLALDGQGQVWAWGDNSYGQCGKGPFVDTYSPVNVSSLAALVGVTPGKGQVDLDGGGDFSLAIRTDRTLASWGDDVYGELGNGYESIAPHLSGFSR